MFLRLTSERAAGALTLLLLGLLAASIAMGANRVGLDSRSEYFFGGGTESWRVVAIQHGGQLAKGIILQIGAGVVAMFLAGAAYMTLQRHGSGFVTAISVGLLAAGTLLLIGSVMSFRLSDLAGQWANASGADAGRIADSAYTAHTVRFFSLLTGLPLLLGSLIAFGVHVQRVSGMPRWLVVFPALSGALLIISPVGFVSIGIFVFFMASGVILFLWLFVLGGRLALRGMR